MNGQSHSAASLPTATASLENPESHVTKWAPTKQTPMPRLVRKRPICYGLTILSTVFSSPVDRSLQFFQCMIRFHLYELRTCKKFECYFMI